MFEEERNRKKKKGKIKIWKVGLFVLLIVGLIAIFLSAYTIDQTEVGVIQTFGKVDPVESGPGLHFKIPIVQTVMKIPVYEQTLEMTTDTNSEIKAMTNEGLAVRFDMATQYMIEPNKASDVYSNLRNYEVWMRSQIRSTARDIIAQFDAESLYGDRRTEVQVQFEEALQNRFEDQGITVKRILIRDVGLPNTVEDRISQKIEAKQEAERMEFVIEKEELEADRKKIEARGIADANQIIANSLDQAYLQWYWIQNLDKHSSVAYVPTSQEGFPIFKDVDSIQE